MAPAAVTTMPGRAVAVGVAVGVAVAESVGDAVGLGATDADGEGVGGTDATHDETRSAQRARNGVRRLVTSSAWLLEHASVSIEPAIRVLLEDPLAAFGVESVVLPLVAQADRMFAERLLADHAARLGHHSSSMSG
jgi:hypothetical protein